MLNHILKRELIEKAPLKSKAKYMFSSIPNTFLGWALVGMMKHFLNRGRYRIRVRGQGLAPGENWRQLPEEMQRKAMGKAFDSGNEVSLPYLWGTTLIAFRADKIEDPGDSWKALWNEKYSGKAMMFGDRTEGLGIGLIANQLPINSSDPEQLDVAADALLEAIDKVETWIQDHYSPKTVRCRVLEEGIIIQLDTNTLEGLVLKNQKETVLKIKNIFHHRPEIGIRFERYQRGSAFLIPG